jgi:hypothetical protein
MANETSLATQPTGGFRMNRSPGFRSKKLEGTIPPHSSYEAPTPSAPPSSPLALVTVPPTEGVNGDGGGEAASLSGSQAKSAPRTPANNFGSYDIGETARDVSDGIAVAGLLLPPNPVSVAAGAARIGSNLNNVQANSAARKASGAEDMDFWDKVQGTFGWNDYGSAVINDYQPWHAGAGVENWSPPEGATNVEALEPGDTTSVRQFGTDVFGEQVSYDYEPNVISGDELGGEIAPEELMGSYRPTEASETNGDGGGSGGGGARNNIVNTFNGLANERPGGSTGRHQIGTSDQSQRDSGRVICTHFVRMKKMDSTLQRIDVRFTYEHLSRATVRGYHFWAVPYVRFMRRDTFMAKIAARVMLPLATWRALECAWQMGKGRGPHLRGKIVRLILEPICWALGQFVGNTDWATLYTDTEETP